MRIFLSFLLFFASGIAHSSDLIDPRKAYVCRPDDKRNYRIAGAVAKYADSAVSGNLESARMIVSSLRNSAEHSGFDSFEGCRFRLWQEIAAGNGDVQSAYEIAFGAGNNDWYQCGRSKYWASFVIRQLSIGEEGAAPDVKLKIRQMRSVLASKCPSLATSIIR